MRLLKCLSSGDFKLVYFNDEDTPPYAILSHTWTEGQEVTYNELVTGAGKEKTGYDKIRFCGRRAAADDLEYFWVDTCCIDKSTGQELSTAINSMFRWYQRASKCYVYLSDIVVPDEIANAESFRITWLESFRRSRWFTRGWTLQELLAPPYVEFFSKNGKRLGSKISLEQEIHEITKIATEALRGQSLAEFSVEERMSWAAQRTTTWKEDKVYCLLGIFGVFLSLIYGEGEAYATLRLREEIERRQVWRGMEQSHDLCASSMLPSSENKLLARQENQRLGDHRKRKREDFIIQQCKRCCQVLQQNIPPQVLLEAPIILFDGFNECFAFSLNFVSSFDFFRDLMARKAREVLEDRFKEKGYTKIWEGEFLLQDQNRRNLDLRRPWKFIMKPGERRYMSIKFRENREMQTSCPHCGMENTASEGQATFCQSCEVMYERIVDLDEEDTTEDKAPRISPPEVLPKTPPKHGITEEELKYCFRRLTLTAPAPPASENMEVMPGDHLDRVAEAIMVGVDPRRDQLIEELLLESLKSEQERLRLQLTRYARRVSISQREEPQPEHPQKRRQRYTAPMRLSSTKIRTNSYPRGYPREETPTERPQEPQQRPRRACISYHAPGTVFRTYTGPREESPPKRLQETQKRPRRPNDSYYDSEKPEQSLRRLFEGLL